LFGYLSDEDYNVLN
jgi:hypothetical protein